MYGAEKIWRQLGREGIGVGRDRVARLMRALGIRGVVRSAKRPTTIPDPTDQRPADLVKRQFTAPAPNRLWVADLTYVATWAGCCHAALVIDASSRLIVGWRVATADSTGRCNTSTVRSCDGCRKAASVGSSGSAADAVTGPPDGGAA